MPFNDSKTLKKICFFIVFLPVAFLVIFFLWIPLLILVCIFLLATFILRKKLKIAYFNSMGKNADTYATWADDDQKSNAAEKPNNQDCYDAEYISLDDKEEDNNKS